MKGLLMAIIVILTGEYYYDKEITLGELNNFIHEENARANNLVRYILFSRNNEELDYSRVILYVNIGIDRPFYSHISYVEDPYDVTVLVNQFYRQPSYFSPSDLRRVRSGQYLREPAREAFLAMDAQMSQLGMNLWLRSSYRNYERQTYLFNRNVRNHGLESARRWSAMPGHSEHQLGLAIDITQTGAGGTTLGAANFASTRHFEWLLEHAHRFGFILRYPMGYTHITGYNFEPWHWRYVGAELATYMYENNISTLEHYFAMRY